MAPIILPRFRVARDIRAFTRRQAIGTRFGQPARISGKRPVRIFGTRRLREEVRALQTSVDLLRQAKKPNPPVEATADRSTAHGPTRIGSNDAQAVVSRTLEFLDEHFAEGQLCLADVAGALGKNEKYISHLFARHVGVRMRTYITMLRLRRASALLLQTGRPIEQIAAEAGFSHASHFRQSFRRSTGLTASKYRQIFASSGPGKIA